MTDHEIWIRAFLTGHANGYIEGNDDGINWEAEQSREREEDAFTAGFNLGKHDALNGIKLRGTRT